ncbi:TPA: hypothetical protein ACH3X3_003510 [Trebouxia sp. C0006]
MDIEWTEPAAIPVPTQLAKLRAIIQPMIDLLHQRLLHQRTPIKQQWEDIIRETDSRWNPDKRHYKCSFHVYFPSFKIQAKHIKWMHHAAGLDKSVDRQPFTLTPGKSFCAS